MPKVRHAKLSSLMPALLSSYTAKIVHSIGAGVLRAREAIASGAARAKLDEFVGFTRKFSA